MSAQTELVIPSDQPLAETASLRLIDTLWKSGALTETSLTLDQEISEGRWEAIGRLFGRVKRASSWWIGDWILYGETAYGERYSQACDATGLDYGTVRNYTYVCNRIARKRRRAELSFGHHAIVAPLEPRDQTKYLKLAIKNGWSREELRQAIKDAGDEQNGAQPQWSDDDTANRAAAIEEAARMLVREASDLPPDQCSVPRERVIRLAALLGEDRDG